MTATDDTTNPGTPIPAAVRPAATGGATITFNPKTMLTLAAFALFGAGGGAGGSQLLGTGMQKEVAALQKEVQDLKHSVETVAVSVVEMKADLKADRKIERKIEEAIDDHEERIRKLEARRR
jgi:hypothetical protein